MRFRRSHLPFTDVIQGERLQRLCPLLELAHGQPQEFSQGIQNMHTERGYPLHSTTTEAPKAGACFLAYVCSRMGVPRLPR